MSRSIRGLRIGVYEHNTAKDIHTLKTTRKAPGKPGAFL
jgi:hypothetical protein